MSYVQRGSIVTCEPQDHEICEFVYAIERGMVFDVSILGNWRPGQTRPASGNAATSCRCGLCGGTWVRPNHASLQFHIRGIGWWP